MQKLMNLKKVYIYFTDPITRPIFLRYTKSLYILKFDKVKCKT